MNSTYAEMLEEYMDITMKCSRVIRRGPDGETVVDDSLFVPELLPTYEIFAKYFATVETIGKSLIDILGWWPDSSVGQFKLDAKVRHEESACYADIIGTFALPTMGLGNDAWLQLICDIHTNQQLVQPQYVKARGTGPSNDPRYHEDFKDYKQLYTNAADVDRLWLLPVEIKKSIENHYMSVGANTWCEACCFICEDRILFRWFMMEVPMYTHIGRISYVLAGACQNKIRKLKEHNHTGMLTHRKEIILDNLQYPAFKNSKLYSDAAHKQIHSIEAALTDVVYRRRK